MASSNNQQTSNLSAGAPSFDPSGNLSGPGVPCGPAPVDLVGRSTVACLSGGVMCVMLFISV